MVKKHNFKVKFLRCDNAGENKRFQQEVERSNYKINFEFTSSNTPQQNGMVERAFTTSYGRIRSMFLECRFKESTKYQLIGEASRTVTMLNNIMTSQVNQKSPHEMLFGSKPKYAKALRRFGELGVVWSGKGIKGKMSNRGTTHLFVGYCDNHAENTYRMLNPKTKKISITRNIKWLNRMYNVKRGIETTERTDAELELEIPGGIKDEPADSEPEEEEDEPGPNPRVLRALKRLETSYNPTLKDMVDIALVGGTKYGHENPVTFQEAWYHKDGHEREK